MSCQSNRYLPEKYGTSPRSAYDRRMYEHYVKGSRTSFDVNHQKKWCPKCQRENYYQPEYSTTQYPRSNFDIKLQKKWCPGCVSPKENYAAALAHHDPDNIWSYTACGKHTCSY